MDKLKMSPGSWHGPGRQFHVVGKAAPGSPQENLFFASPASVKACAAGTICDRKFPNRGMLPAQKTEELEYDEEAKTTRW